MHNQHAMIKGYRDLSQTEIDAMNNVKNLAISVGIILDGVTALPDVDKRWAAIAKTDLQTGFMALIRAIARPTTF